MRQAIPGLGLSLLLSTLVPSAFAGGADPLERLTSPVAIDSSGAAAQAPGRRPIKE